MLERSTWTPEEEQPGGGKSQAKALGRRCQEALRHHGWVSKAGRGGSGQSAGSEGLADFCKTLLCPWIEMRATGGLVQEQA